MNNEIGRKITSLTLMTIMIAGGMTIASQGVMPVAFAANANLFVSAENSQFDNYMSGPQVIEVVVIDSDINDTDQGEGEPDVTINGKILRMAQATDGNWYGYFADRAMAQIADSTVDPANQGTVTVGVVGEGMDFGSFCSNAVNLGDPDTVTTVLVGDTVGVAIPRPDAKATELTVGSSTGAAITQVCGATTVDQQGDVSTMVVIREAKDLNTEEPTAGEAGVGGQIGIETAFWPFIQLYSLNPTGNIVIQYNKGGGVQSTTLTFDTVEGYAGLNLDRTIYPQRAEIHATITDLWMNIDPTDEDSWTFGTLAGSLSTNYQVFDENGGQPGDTATNTDTANGSLTSQLGNLMCEDNCVLRFNANAQGATNAVATLQDNDDSAIVVTAGGAAQTITNWETANNQLTGFVPITVTEIGPNAGIFSTYDELDTSALIITNNAARGTSATIDYNETPQTILVGFEFATIDIQPFDDEWSSGEEIPVVLVDNDANKNSRVDEDLDLFNAGNEIIPALSTGSPFTLTTDDNYYFATNFDTSGEDIDAHNPDAFAAGVTTVFDTPGTDLTFDRFSQRAVINTDNTVIDLASTNQANGDSETGSALFIDFNARTLIDLKAVVRDTLTNGRAGVDFSGFNFFNYDIRTLNQNQDDAGHAIIETDIYLVISDVARGAVPSTEDITPANLDGNQADADLFCLVTIAVDQPMQGLINLNDNFLDELYDQDANSDCVAVGGNAGDFLDTAAIGVVFLLDDLDTDLAIFPNTNSQPIVVDFFSFGFTDDGVTSGERVADQIIRLELEESGDNTGSFEGTLEYFMVNQLTINTLGTYTGLVTISDEAGFIVIEDLTDEDSPRVNYDDRGADGVVTQVSDQEEAPSHSGVVSFDSDSYKIADTVVITLEDADLNVNSDLIDIYTIVSAADALVDANAGAGNVDNHGNTYDVVGIAATQTLSFGELGRLLDVTFNDLLWSTPDVNLDDVTDAAAGAVNNDACRATLAANNVGDTGFGATGFTLVETSAASGVFTGDFQIPNQHCPVVAATLSDATDGYTWALAPVTSTGVDLEVNYVDFRDASGEIIEVGDSAGVRANTGSVSLDRTVYPVPFGTPRIGTSGDFTTTALAPTGDSIFAIHASGMNANNLGTAGTFLSNGDLTIHVRVNDPDFDISATGEDTIGVNTAADVVGPVKLSVIRGANTVVLGYVGGPAVIAGVIDVADAGFNMEASNGAGAAATALSFRVDVGAAQGDTDTDGILEVDNPAGGSVLVRQFGPITEIAPDAGIFEADIVIRYTDGPASTICPTTDFFTNIIGTTGTEVELDRFSVAAAAGTEYCILQGDILQVEYTDPEDASGNPNTVTDSATFDLRNGVLQSDKSVYIIGSDMIMTLIEPDLDLDNDGAETYDLDLIEWDSDAATVTMGDRDGEGFDPEPDAFRETGDSTGIFQIVIEIPEVLANDRLERGEEIVLEYTDWGPSGADFVGQEDEDINLTIYTSNFGATVELDQKVYTWTDKVYITIVAPDHNFDSDLIDTIGETTADPVKVSTRGFDIDQYSLVETGTDTGIFTGEVILVGFDHDATGDGVDDNPAQGTSADLTGPTDGFLETDDDDGLTVSFEFSEDETVVGSALIRWNIGEVQWLEASYPASGTGVVRIIDPDMNLNPEAVDNFNVDVWSDSDAGGIDLTVTETNEATGIFEGTVFFTVSDESSGHRLRVSEGDTVTGEYEDNTLPDPYTRADELDISATTLIGTIVPPLERAPAANLRTVDAFGNSLDTVSVDQQVQISADLANGQDREQPFAYLVQIQDGNGVTVSLAWITGSLSSGQSFSPALSWIPTSAGTYTATAFVWESIDNPTALSPPVSTTITVN